jgi:hypothetical protein
MKAHRIFLALAALAALVAPAALAAGPDADAIVRYLAPKGGLYQLEVENTSDIGYIKSFDWTAPAGLTITAIRKTTGGTCRMAENGFSCVGAERGIAPPKHHTVPGGSLMITFTATGYSPKFNGHYWTYYGWDGRVAITGVSPAPAAAAAGPGQDLPVCDADTQPGPDNGCS